MGEAIYDAQIVDLLTWLAMLVRCSKPAVVAVEVRPLPRLGRFVGHLKGALVHWNGPFALDYLPEFPCFLGIFHLRGGPDEHTSPGLVRSVASGLEDFQCFVSKIFLVPSFKIMDPN